jgi:hypothetical protein
VYTVNFGDYDELSKSDYTKGVEHHYFTNQDVTVSGWNVHRVSVPQGEELLYSRLYKMFPHIIFPDSKYSVYRDASFKYLMEPAWIFDTCKVTEMAFFKHPSRKKIIEELFACIELNKISRGEADIFLHFLNRCNPEAKNLRVLSGGVIYRNHNSGDVDKCMNIWWNYFCQFPRRDQLTLPLALKESKMKYGVINANIFRNSALMPREHRLHAGIIADMKLNIKCYIFKIINTTGLQKNAGLDLMIVEAPSCPTENSDHISFHI